MDRPGLSLLLLLAACGGGSAGATGSAGDGGSGSGSDDAAAASTGPGGEATSAGGDSSSGPTPGDGSTGSSGGAETGQLPKYDLGTLPDVPPVQCGGDGDGGGGNGGGGNVELSYIWIANSVQSTISKINTSTMEEEGRYLARPSGGDPSRTSVNLQGDVAVANRNGGVTKFYANVEDCSNTNGQPGIQTSTGGTDILPWEDEECRAWHVPLVCDSNRPVAWTRGEWNPDTCAYEGANLWTVCDSTVMLLDGETGETLQTVALAGSAFVYGGAADADGNFWGLDTGTGQLVRVDHQDYSLLTFGLPSSGAYGITVDREGRPWVCSSTVARFNLDTSTWSISPDSSGGGGCMTDGETTIWHGTSEGMVGFDTETLLLIESIPLPEYVHGISVDFEGKVWGVGFSSSNAFRADPETDTVDTFSQLVGAYTYSDMTGFQLSSAGGGGVPQG